MGRDGRDKERVFGEYLVLAAQAGDRAALAQLVSLWEVRLARHARRLTGDAEAARDALQEAWVDIVRGLGGLRRSDAFPAWAYRIVTRKCAAWIRTRQRDRALSDDLTAELDIEGEAGPDDAEALAETRDGARRVLALIRTLPAPQRAAMALFHLDGLGVAEIAIALDAPAGTIKTRLMHARRKIRDALEAAPADETSTPITIQRTQRRPS